MPENDELKKYLDYDGLDYLIKRIPRTRIIVTFDDVFAGETATCSLGTTTYTNTVPVTEPYQLVFSVVELGTWTIATSYLGEDYGTTIEVTGVGTTATGHVSYVNEIDGETVTPTDDITTWLKCANIEDPSITTLADVLANRYLFETLIANSNACNYMARSTTWADDVADDADAMALIGRYDYCSNELLSNATWAEAIGNSDYFEEVLNVKVPVMTSNTTPSGECISIGSASISSYPNWHAFDNSSSTWYTPNPQSNAWIGYKFTSQVICKKASILLYSGTSTVAVQGSNDLTTWATLKSDISASSSKIDVIFNNDTSYLAYRIQATGELQSVIELQFYGRSSNEVLVPLVPTMTSDTTPSGQVMYSSATSGGEYKTYGLFDNNTSTTWMPINESTYGENNAWCGYDFGKQVIASRYTIYHTMNRLTGWNIEGSNDGETWTVLDSKTNQTITSPPVLLTYDIPSENQVSYRYLRLRHTSSAVGSPSSTPVGELQFYSKTVETNIIHSAANDTIYMLDNGVQVPLCTTNSNGDGILDFSQFMDGTYTLYSSVAKDPTNLSNDYSKSIRITKTLYGCTTEAYLIPDTVKTLYWYGNILEKWQDCNATNGWTISISGYSIYNNTSYNTNDINIWSTSSRANGCGSSNKLLLKKIHFIGKITSSAWGLYAKATKTKVLDGSNTVNIDQQNVVMYKSADVTQDYYYLIISIYDARNGNAYALWYE